MKEKKKTKLLRQSKYNKTKIKVAAILAINVPTNK